MTRRDLLAAAGVAALAGCGAAAGSAERAATIGMVESRVPRASVPAEAVATASRAVAAFTRDLYLANAGDRGNIVCSPYSVAIALGMTLQGARGTTATEMLGVLHSPDTAALAAGLGGIDAQLAVLTEEASAPMPQREVVADRPFLYVIHDLPTKTPLFVGRVLTPHS